LLIAKNLLIFIKMKEKKINIALSPKILKKIDDANYNRNKLLVALLRKKLGEINKN